MTLYTWSTTAANNATADTTINAREGMAPSQVNDAMRAMMAAVAKWRADSNGSILTTGTSTAYAITTSQVYSSLATGLTVSARVHVASGAAPTLNVDSLGAKAIASAYGTAIGSGRLRINRVYTFTYNATDNRWIVVGFQEEFATNDTPLFFQAAAPTGYTKQTTHDDKAIRIVSGTGAGSGGTRSFSTTMTARTILQANLPSYTLPNTFAISAAGSHSHAVPVRTATGVVSSGGGVEALVHPTNGFSTGTVNEATDTEPTHTHAITGSVTSGGSGTALDFAMQYIDVIACAKD